MSSLLLVPLLCLAQEPAPDAREPARVAAPLESGLVRSLELEPLPGTVASYFRLDPADARAASEPIGLLRYVAGPDPEGGTSVDLELHFLAEGLRVFHAERVLPASRRLVFRELREGSGRTLFLEGSPGAGLEGYELGVGEVVRRTCPEGGALPLGLIEAARQGARLPEETRVLDPLAGAFETVQLVQRGEAAGPHGLEARRSDGSLLWRVQMEGAELTEWRFHEGGPVARPIPRAEFEALHETHERSVRRAREAASRVPLPEAIRPR